VEPHSDMPMMMLYRFNIIFRVGKAGWLIIYQFIIDDQAASFILNTGEDDVVVFQPRFPDFDGQDLLEWPLRWK
jgi:hypothetical protein